MQPQQAGGSNGHGPPTAQSVGARSEVDRLRATCRRQAHVIDTLSAAVSTLRRGAAALKSENADLRAAHDQNRSRGRVSPSVSGGLDVREALEVHLPLDVRAPGAARIVVAECLRGRPAASIVDGAQLVVSELVTNSVLHSGGSSGEVVVVRVQVTSAMVRIEVEDPGRAGTIAPRRPDLDGGGGLGLNLVQALSERWGLERVAASRTRIWAQLRCAPSIAVPSADASDKAGGARLSRRGRPTSGRATAERQRRPARGAL